MIKRVSKILNNRLILHKRYRFSAEQTPEKVQQQQEVAQQTTEEAQAVQGEQTNTEIEVAQQQDQAPQKYVRKQIDDFDGVNLLEANWNYMAKFVNTKYYLNKDDPALRQQVNARMEQFEDFINFDIENLQKFGINSRLPAKVLPQIFGRGDFKYLDNNLSENTKISHTLAYHFRIANAIQSNDLKAIRILHANNIFNQHVSLPPYLVNIIFTNVLANDYKTAFFLNIIQSIKMPASEEGQKLKPLIASGEKILRKVADLEQVNTLAFAFGIHRLFDCNKMEQQLIFAEVSKISLEGLQAKQFQKEMLYIYNFTLGKHVVHQVIEYALAKFGNSYLNFVKFWGLFNVFMHKLCNLKDISLKNPTGLNAIFNLMQLNLHQDTSKQIITKLLPEILHHTKNYSLFETYRIHAKNWIQKRTIPEQKQSKSNLQSLIKQKTDSAQNLKVVYNGWKSDFASIKNVELVTSTKAQKAPQTDVLNENQIVLQLIKGQYNTVLNHFLLSNLHSWNKLVHDKVRKIIKSTEDIQFSDQNTRALYILNELKKILFYNGQPVAFDEKYFTNFKGKSLEFLFREKQEKQKQKKPFANSSNPFVKKMQTQGHYSKKRAEKIDPSAPGGQFEHVQKIFHKPKKYQQSGLSKKTKNQFATQKQLFSTEKDSYSEYREVVKQINSRDTDIHFTFSRTDLKGFQQQIQQKQEIMNPKNHLSLLNTKNIPVLGNGQNLLKFLFLKKSESKKIELSDNIVKKLQVSFQSEIGVLQKDYSQYLVDCRFQYALPKQVYISLLKDIKNQYIRKSFKTVVSHMIAYRQQLSFEQIEIICQISKQNKIGITLLQIYTLIVNNRIKSTTQSVYKICDTLQRFKSINKDIFMLTKKYCTRIEIPFQIKMMSTYVRSLLLEQDDDTLSKFCGLIKDQLRPPNYKLNSQLSAVENIKREKEHKIVQNRQANFILYQIIDMVVLNVNNKLPAFISELFDEYTISQPKLSANQIALSMIVYANDTEKVLEIIRTLKENQDLIVPLTYECWLKAAFLNLKGLGVHAEQIFNVVLFTHNFLLTEQEVLKTVQLFKAMNNSTIFIKFLEYVLRYNPPVSQQVKHTTYTVMNNINDDFSKNIISGLLDFIFNNNREKEREEYRKGRIVEEEKLKLIKNLQTTQRLTTQGEQTVKQVKKLDSQTLEDAKRDKPLANLTEKQKAAKASQQKLLKPKVENVQKKDRLKMKNLANEQIMHLDNSQGVIKRLPTNVNRKHRSEALDKFSDIFAARQVVEEDPKGKKGGASKGKEKDSDKGKKKK